MSRHEGAFGASPTPPRPLVVDVLRQLAANGAMSIPAIRNRRLSKPRHSGSYSPDLLDRHALSALRRLQRIASPMGKSIVEFGPGDNLVSGLALLASGAKRYCAVDRFVPDYTSAESKRWYVGLKEHWPGEWPSGLDPERFPEDYPERVSWTDGGVEVAQPDGEFDIVCSWQVGEHVSDIDAFARLSAQLVTNDGLVMHRIDFGPHDCWRNYDDGQTFLRFPDWLWHAMSSQRGSPNRRRYHEFEEAFVAAGLTVIDHAETRHFGRPARHLARRFRRMPQDALMVRDTIFVCRATYGITGARPAAVRS